MDRVFIAISIMLGLAAAYFFWAGNADGMYVCAVLGCVAFFLSVRVQTKARVRILDEERAARQAAADENASDH